MEPSPEHITALGPNEVFVFGSNRIGKHGKGAAKTALQWGAKWGVGEGLMGRTYGIPTKGHDMRVSLPLEQIALHVARFRSYAAAHPELVFLVTEIGCGLANYAPKDIAPLFAACRTMSNVRLPVRFIRVIERGA